MIKVTRGAEVAIIVGPEDVMPRLAPGQVWRFGRRLEIGVFQIARGANLDGDDLVSFGPLDRNGKVKSTLSIGATLFLSLVTRFGGRLRDRS